MCEPKARVPLRVPVLGAAALVAAGAVLAVAPSVVAAVVAVSVAILAACPVCAVAAFLFVARSRAGFGLRVEHGAPAAAVARPRRALPAPQRALEGVVVTPVPASLAWERVRVRG